MLFMRSSYYVCFYILKSQDSIFVIKSHITSKIDEIRDFILKLGYRV